MIRSKPRMFLLLVFDAEYDSLNKPTTQTMLEFSRLKRTSEDSSSPGTRLERLMRLQVKQVKQVEPRH